MPLTFLPKLALETALVSYGNLIINKFIQFFSDQDNSEYTGAMEFLACTSLVATLILYNADIGMFFFDDYHHPNPDDEVDALGLEPVADGF